MGSQSDIEKGPIDGAAAIHQSQSHERIELVCFQFEIGSWHRQRK